MARPRIPTEPSPYYPPRARWYAPFFYLGNAVRRRLALDRLKLPRDLKAGELAAGFLIPGLAVWLRGPRLWGQAALAGSGGLALIFLAFLGYSFGNLALGLLVSLHATGFYYYCSPVMAGETFGRRLAFALLILLAVGLLLYLPARSVIQQHCLIPLRVNGQVVIVRRTAGPQNVRRGDWVAYTFDRHTTGRDYHGGTVILEGGLSLGPVLAVAGDHVTFSTNSFSVNGVVNTNRLPHLPTAGALAVPENHWFIWPNLGISGHGNVGEARISEALMGLADVNQSQLVGKPFQRWFWRRQILP
jgi:hypothetical protein